MRRSVRGRGLSEEQSDVVIIGAGFAGLCMAIQLAKSGVRSFTVLERGGDLGGTWRENRYPGCACDVQSPLYSYSFEPNAGWSRMFAERAEIHDYLRHCAHKYELLSHVRFNENVVCSRFDETRRQWVLQTERGQKYRAGVVVAAMGALSNPSYPRIQGAYQFQGEHFHSAEWNGSYDLTGKRVAVIGTGASAIQFVPQIAPAVARLDLYQRTAPWVMPKPDRAIGKIEKALYRALPFLQKLVRWAIYCQLESRVLAFAGHPKLMRLAAYQARRYIRREISDPELREKVTPNYVLGCKRVLISNDYYAALSRANVHVITHDIREIRPHSVVDATGEEREVDAIIYGTGFKVQELVPRGAFFGRGARDLADAWSAGPEAYKGTCISGFPNLFFLLGPNTGLGHSSMIFMIESQVRYVLDALRQMKEQGWSAVEVEPTVQAEFNRGLQERSESAVWSSGCTSWYLAESGRNTAIWPDFTFRFRRATRTFDAAAYRIEQAAGNEEQPAPEPLPPGAAALR